MKRVGRGFREGMTAEEMEVPENDVAGGQPAKKEKQIRHSNDGQETHGGFLLEIRENDHNGS